MTMTPAMGSRAVAAGAGVCGSVSAAATVAEAKFCAVCFHHIPSATSCSVAMRGCLSTGCLAAGCNEKLGLVSFPEWSKGSAGNRSLAVLGRAGGVPRPSMGAAAPRFPRRQLEENNRQNEDRASNDGPLINNQIRVPSVRLVDEEQNMVGVVPTQEALQRSRDMELDLVLIAPDADPPVARIMDYSKFKYESAKRKREQQRKSAANRMELKELKMRYNIDTHDYDVRLRAAQRFLRDGNKVKVVVQFKGREMEFKDYGTKLFERFERDLGDLALVESKLTLEGRSMVMVFAPISLHFKASSTINSS
ncbi:hypothetical protein O6H91_Y220000 [Diphasiastrum complanatum]|nr:hypothetical protein O6H91_Y220000 [Diphasiastrum complanatum]